MTQPGGAAGQAASADDALGAEWAAMVGLDDGAGEEEVSQGPEAALASTWAETLRKDELAAPGQRAASAPGADQPSRGGRTLSQDEIDSLLGVSAVAMKKDKSGIMSLVHSKEVTYERLPMLEVVFDRLERMLTTSVRNFTSDNVDISLENITAQRFGDYLNSVPLPAMISVFKAVEWDNYGLVTVDSPMIYSIVDVLLGGRRGTVPMRIEGRPYTTIEACLIERLIRLILDDLSQAFAPITPVHFRFERTETNPRFAAIARPGNACVVFKLRIDLEDRGGTIEFLIPYATLEPARDLLLQMFMGEKFGRDSIWESHLAREIWLTDVELEAVLDEQVVSLGQVLDLRVGSVIPLSTRPDSIVRLRCGDVPMMTGRVGRLGERIVIEVEERLDHAKEPTVD
jgi:flagellar motor switch protein FliM